MAVLLSLLALTSAPAAVPADVLAIASDGVGLTHSDDFARAASAFVCDKAYLIAESSPGGRSGSIRVQAPEGDYYAYIAWARHPRGARRVTVRVAGRESEVDQSRLANGLVPEDFPHDDMGGFEGICTSGLYRLTDQPVHFGKGDAVELVRSDVEPGTYTTLNYVLFSPHLYLDDLGNDATLEGRPLINLRECSFTAAPEVGMGLVVLTGDAATAAVEFTVPSDGLYRLSVNPSMGPSRAAKLPIEVTFADGSRAKLGMVGHDPAYGRKEWQTLGALRAAKGAKLRAVVVDGGCSCPDLLRLTPVPESELVAAAETRYESFRLQWEEPSPARPWLEHVNVAGNAGTACEARPLEHSAGLPHGVEVQAPVAVLPVIGATDGSAVRDVAHGSFRVELADDYGFTLTSDLLRSQPFLWLRDLGMFVCATGDFASHDSARRRMRDTVTRAAREPFLSTSEKYYRETGFNEAEWGIDRRAFGFAYDTSRPLAPRVSDSIDAMPEVDYEYFADRIQNPKDRTSFLGWANVAQHFYVLSSGAIGTSSNAAAGTGHPRAEDFSIRFGVGEDPVFMECGDASVTQWMDDGYHLVCNTRWKAGATEVTESAFAYPLVGEEAVTGYEPLAAFVRLAREGGGDPPLWLEVKPDPFRPEWSHPLKGLGGACVDDGVLLAGDRVVLACGRGRLSISSASDDLVLVRAQPEAGHLDLVVPYIAVDRTLVAAGRELGFDSARTRMKAYWDRRLRKGAAIETPDPVVNEVAKSLYVNTLITGEIGTDGLYALKTSPIVYDAVWLHATAYGIEGLARRGYFEEAKQYLDACFAWQGSQPAQEAKDFTTWDGFFNAPPHYTPALWLNFHGWTQWAAARYFLFSDDRTYLEEKLPQLVRSLEWTASQRRITMVTAPDGSRAPNYGWLPPARVTDGSAGTSTFSDCVNWMGFAEVTLLLERIGHPRAAEFRAEADDYRACILRGLRLATRKHEPVRLSDGTWVPYVPGYLESTSNVEHSWYAAVADCGLEGPLDTGVLPSGEPMERWLVGNLEDNLFCLAPNLVDEAAFLGHAINYVRRDQVERAIYTWYSVLASHMARETRITFEHRSWGASRVWDLAPWPMGYYTRMLADMLCYSESDGIEYCRAAPRAWLDPGKHLRIADIQTRFGPTTLALEGTEGGVRGFVEVPTRHAPAWARLRLRVNGDVTSVWLNGKPVAFDKATGEVLLPAAGGRVTVEADVRR